MESSPTFEDFMREDDHLATKLRTATECCFDSDSGHAVRRTCSISQAVSTRHASLLLIWLTLMLTLTVNIAMYIPL